MSVKLSGPGLNYHLHEARGWVLLDDRDAIRKTFHFEDFGAAFGFLAQIALLAEKMNHHPEIFNEYNRVEIILTTHEVDGLTELDFKFAREVDEIAPLRDHR